MQFTGLLDCEGREIWEGDLIRSVDERHAWEVVYDDACFWVQTNARMIELYEYHSFDIKVIGNKWETPELLD